VSKNNQILYICYFGLLEPLVQTQVIPYLHEIAKAGPKVHLLTFERDLSIAWTSGQTETEKEILARSGIEWHYLPYHKRFSLLATGYDVVRGAIFASRFLRKGKASILHARAHIPLVMALLARKFAKGRVIFDIRGLMAEEYVDAGVWRNGSLPFRIIKKVERSGLRLADEVVVLTEKLRDYLIENRLRDADTITVIPCCVDFSRIDSSGKQKQAKFELVYAGSVTGLYMLEQMGRLFLELKATCADAFFRVLTAGDPEYVRRVFNGIGISEADFSVEKIPPADILNVIGRSEVAISFRKPTFSQIAASPTKVAEYLACGIPVIVNSGIGDTTEQVNGDKTGVVVETFDRESYASAIKSIMEMKKQSDLSDRCVRAAKERFDLQTVGGPRYRRIYKRLLDSK
jgi:glycosyltransferase involved in cell wall biosynthesis